MSAAGTLAKQDKKEVGPMNIGKAIRELDVEQIEETTPLPTPRQREPEPEQEEIPV